MYLTDTNVLLSLTNPKRPDYAIAFQAIQTLQSANTSLYYTGQVAAEYWRVATAPTTARNGFGWDVVKADTKWQDLQTQLFYLEENHLVLDAWYQLVNQHQVVGQKVYDARFVAFVQVYRLSGIITFNTGDFAPYGVAVLHPTQV